MAYVCDKVFEKIDTRNCNRSKSNGIKDRRKLLISQNLWQKKQLNIFFKMYIFSATWKQKIVGKIEIVFEIYA